MSNGYLLAADADLAAAHEIAGGFGLDVISGSAIADPQATTAALANVANVGIILSNAAARDGAFVALLQTLATNLRNVQLIVDGPEARAAFAFLPSGWPSMSLEEARSRSAELMRRRQAHEGAGAAPPRAHPLPAQEETPQQQQEEAPPIQTAPKQAAPEKTAHEQDTGEALAGAPEPDVPEDTVSDEALLGGLDADDGARDAPSEEFGAEREQDATALEPPVEPEPEAPPEPPAYQAPESEPAPHPPASAAPPAAAAPEPPPATAPAPSALPQTADRSVPAPPPLRTRQVSTPSAPADATAFAPKKLRRGMPELVHIVIHQPKDLGAVVKTARKIDPRTEPAPSGMSIGDVALGAKVGVSLEARGASCDGTVQRRTWTGDAIDFNFSVEPDADVKQAVFLARVFVDDAQIGVLAFTRRVSGPAQKAASAGDRIRLKRHKRVFLSYSSKDRETVAAIATAYAAAGVAHFWDRTSLKSGEEWHPRLQREIDRADLFHLCWSKSAAASQWVEKEAEHALMRRRRTSDKKPDITVQMLDGPPWAKHPPHLDSINFDDFVRAAIVGYARGDGES